MATLRAVPTIRIRQGNQAPLRAAGSYVLYWMIAARRLHYNFALDRALEHCRELRKPLLILEALRCGYPWASDRLHAFVLQGMATNARECEKAGVRYYDYVEPEAGAGRGLLSSLAAEACVVVTDEFPCFFLPRMVEVAGKKLAVRLEVVDSNGLLPLRAASQAYPTAYAFRRFLQKTLPSHLTEVPAAAPLAKKLAFEPVRLSPEIAKQWPSTSTSMRKAASSALASLPIDHQVQITGLQGGHEAARSQMLAFFRDKLKRYREDRNEPELDGGSGLSPHLHFGHISVHEVFAELARVERRNPTALALRATGKREGWWNMSANAESFLDELITWRELGYNFSFHRTDYDRYESLPPWALQTLKQHLRDEREHAYTLEQFERGRTHDALWNAAQMQLVTEGRIHNYLRMLWGKKILEWSRTPEEALKTLIHLNNKYGLDGRNPNSYSGIFWCLGRYDRPWGPERPIFGKVRYMSSENTARKVSVKDYIQKYAPGSQSRLSFA
jgi:deoxyribodipyrimidine photo-lyase